MLHEDTNVAKGQKVANVPVSNHKNDVISSKMNILLTMLSENSVLSNTLSIAVFA